MTLGTTLTLLGCGLALSGAPVFPAAGAQPPAPAQPPASRPAPPTVEWVDFQRALWRLDAALAGTDIDKSGIVPIVDHAHFAWRQGRPWSGVRLATDLSSLLETGERLTPDARTLESLGVRFDKPVLALSEATTCKATVLSLFPTLEEGETERTFDFALVLEPTDGQAESVAVMGSFGVTAQDAGKAVVDIDASSMSPGAYRVLVRTADGDQIERGFWYVVDRPLAEGHEERSRRLLAINDAALESAVVTCSTRNDLVTDTPSGENAYQSQTDLLAMLADVEREVAALESGQNPYANLEGHSWRQVRFRDTQRINLRVYAPKLDAEERPGMIIALPGAASDENAFMESLGQGVITEFADRHNCVVASVNLIDVMPAPELFDAILESVTSDYDIDPGRVIVVGHSLGGAPTLGWARERRDQIAKAVIVAGMGRLDPQKPPSPTYVIAGAEDRLFPSDRLAEGVSRGQSQGVDVRFRLLPNVGHFTSAAEGLRIGLSWALGEGE